MGINMKIIKFLFLTVLILLCLLLPVILFKGGNSDSQINSPAVTQHSNSDEGILSIIDSNESILENVGSESFESIRKRIDPNGDLAFLEKDIMTVLAPDSTNSSNMDIRDYIKQDTVKYEQTRAWYQKDQLPILYELLEDDAFALCWDNITRVIGYISDGNDFDSVNILLNYFRRNDSTKNFNIYGKIWSLAWIGKIGTDQADSILRKALTKEGARELAKSWIDEDLWQKDRYKRQKENVFIDIQSAALDGLVYTGKKENLDLVEKFYNEQKDISIKNKAMTNIMLASIDAMAKKDYIGDHGLESWLKYMDHADLNIIYPYVKKYSFKIEND